MEPEVTSLADQRRAELQAKEQETLDVIKKDVCEWLTKIGQPVTVNSFWPSLDTGVVVCQLAKQIQTHAKAKGNTKIPMEEVSCNPKATPSSFVARDNVANFIRWCRKLGVPDTVMFESNGLVMHTEDKRVVLSLLEVGRHAGKIGMVVPQLVKLEEEIEATEASEEQIEGGDGDVVTPNRTTMVPSPVKAQLPPPSSPTVTKTPIKIKGSSGLEKQVLDIIQQCTCKDKITVCSSKNAKFVLRIVNKRYTLFARVLSDRIMVRVGGGWDTLDHFLLKHDACRGAHVQIKKATSVVNGKGVVSSNVQRFVEETDGGRCEEAQDKTPTSTPLASTPQQSSPDRSTSPVATMAGVLLLALALLYVCGLKTPVLIGVAVLILVASIPLFNKPTQQDQLTRKKN